MRRDKSFNMIEIAKVIAATYMDVKGTGRNRPCIFHCVDQENKSEEYIVKFYGAIRELVICEVSAALLGQALGINIPDIAIVYADQRLAQFIRDGEARENFKKEPGPHFGSHNLKNGYSVMSSGYNLANESLLEALNIFAFDMLIQNMDRTASGFTGNSNILYKGHKLYAIDHELSFSFINVLGGSPEPWKLRGSELVTRHVFYLPLRKHSESNEISFSKFLEKLAAMPDEYMENVMQALPSEWYNERYAEKIIAHISLIRRNIERFHKGLLEVFA